MSASDPSDILNTVREGISQIFGDPPKSPEQRLLARRDAKRRRWLRHKRVYLVMISGLFLLNLVIGISTGFGFPWAAFPAIAWGTIFAFHGLSYRAWAKENARAIRDAEVKLGLLPAPTLEPQLPVGERYEIDGLVIQDPLWLHLIQKARNSIDRVKDAFDDGRAGGTSRTSRTSAAATVELEASLEHGLKSLERLAAGAERIRGALLEIAPRGLEGLSQDVAKLDRQIAATTSESVRATYLENRALLIARRAKVEGLEAEAERLRATAETFLLASENVRLDLAKLDANDEKAAVRTMSEPVGRLVREVEILKQVEAELRQF